MIDDFILRALAAGLGIACLTGPLGCFVVWRRMSYFGETLSHSALLGIVLGMILGISPLLGVLLVCAGIAYYLTYGMRTQYFAQDTLLGGLSHGALSLGLILLALNPVMRTNPLTLLFGDILTTSSKDLWVIYGGGLGMILILRSLWKPFLKLAVDPELAAVSGMNVRLYEFIFMMLMALTVAMTMRIVGVLLITSLLILPAATARHHATSPEKMAYWAIGYSALSVVLGISASFWLNIPSGPAIVLTAFVLFSIKLVRLR